MARLRREIYPKPGPVGGKLIRKVISALDALGVKRPLAAPVRLAVSGGPDSLALALLIVRYGRRVAVAPRILHLNHHWRGRESGQDQRFVRSFAKKLGAPFEVKNLSARVPRGESLEAWGRDQRQKVFGRYRRGWVLLAHHADDQAETVLWRVLSGAPRAQWAGIYPENGRVLRPLLDVTRSDLLAFLKEEKVSARLDRSNEDTRFLRARIRRHLVPQLNETFPRWRDSLVKVAEQARSKFGKNVLGKSVPVRQSRR